MYIENEHFVAAIAVHFLRQSNLVAQALLKY